ncbi:MAG: glycosyltransferase [Chloroflexota bacterium]
MVLKKSTPLVSIITSSLNQGEFIESAITSVDNQSYANIEHIIIDGGSTDNTLTILQNHSSNFSWLSEPDKGQSNAINKGIEKSSGELISWLNADDTLDPEAVSTIVANFNALPEVDFLYGNCDYIDAQGEFIRSYPTQDFDLTTLIQETHVFIPQPATFIRKTALEKVGRLNEDFDYVMDLDLWIRLGLSGNGQHIHEKLANLRLHQSAKSLNKLAAFAPELVRLYEDLFSQDDLPYEIKQVEKTGTQNIYLRAADISLWSKEYNKARSYTIKAVSIKPITAITTKVKSLAFPLMGKIGYWIKSLIMENPYEI